MKMLIRQRPLDAESLTASGWGRVPDLSTPTERNTFTLTLSDGTSVEAVAEVTYAPGEREAVLEAVMGDREPSDDLLRVAQSFVLRRRRAEQVVYANLASRYGSLPKTRLAPPSADA